MGQSKPRTAYCRPPLSCQGGSQDPNVDARIHPDAKFPLHYRPVQRAGVDDDPAPAYGRVNKQKMLSMGAFLDRLRLHGV